MTSSLTSPLQTARNYLELVKFSHTIFALPFALASMLIAAHGFPALRIFGWILAAMIGARTAAMGFNRIVDRQIDAQNPRTQNRELPAGKVSLKGAISLVIVASLLFFFAAYQLNFLALLLSPITLSMLFFYSFCKRFTSFSHFVLGLCLGIAPVGAHVAVTGKIDFASCVLAAAILVWTAGFDIIYATMDIDFDQKAGLHSMVSKLGVSRALGFAKWLHALFLVFLFAFGILANLGAVFSLAVALIAAFLVYEHSLVHPDDLRRVNAAFFTVNGTISVFFLLVVTTIVFWK
ncbi:4-hydroxybenzoate polyprenyltransferase [Abditibacterium utsteinense]|uniref:4-hydroxybenzoate polyprenyltransferase n=1 Tax=Abditibacterium utsteinense TaxID=1960156 RepID=A0A2S8SP54_9BACT|nr:UbiA-like polyprenyltransferase [Abditibacterium utsteinense]PQV62571.1 4-hydroxybenzoate polyprenyltransferase [Abditibacterium utsteinense]